MNYKSFVFKILSIVFIVVFSAASFIYFIDPMWTFGHKHKYNDVQTVINERQQKTNQIKFLPFEYDTLLIGSSRSTYINEHEFSGMNVFNYAVSNISIQEYSSFIEYAKSERGREFDTIIIGLDFFKSSIKESSAKLSIDQYATEANKPFYRYKNLLSYDLLEYSWQNFKTSRNNKVEEERVYNREHVASAKDIDPSLKEKQTIAKIEKFRKEFYGETYQYNPDYKNILMELKKNNPNTKFIIFTTPISTPLFTALVDEGRLTDYENWLEDIVSVFGGVYNFMYPNTVTNDINNYFDGHHFYPPVGTLIAHRISQDEDENLPADFGVYVDDEHIAVHIKTIKDSSEKLLTYN